MQSPHLAKLWPGPFSTVGFFWGETFIPSWILDVRVVNIIRVVDGFLLRLDGLHVGSLLSRTGRPTRQFWGYRSKAANRGPRWSLFFLQFWP